MENTELFRNLMVMAAIDGRFNNSEMELLADRCAMWGIDDNEFSAALEYALAPGAELTIPGDLPSQITFLKECLRVMGADGHLAEQEKQLFSLAAAQMKLNDGQLNDLIDEVLVADDV
jgi:uncharacterized tellurite resistance protein B-like protein